MSMPLLSSENPIDNFLNYFDGDSSSDSSRKNSHSNSNGNSKSHSKSRKSDKHPKGRRGKSGKTTSNNKEWHFGSAKSSSTANSCHGTINNHDGGMTTKDSLDYLSADRSAAKSSNSDDSSGRSKGGKSS